MVTPAFLCEYNVLLELNGHALFLDDVLADKIVGVGVGRVSVHKLP